MMANIKEDVKKLQDELRALGPNTAPYEVVSKVLYAGDLLAGLAEGAGKRRDYRTMIEANSEFADALQVPRNTVQDEETRGCIDLAIKTFRKAIGVYNSIFQREEGFSVN